MAPFAPSRGARALALLLLLPMGAVAATKPAKKVVELTPWQMAEQAREQLMSIPAEQRTHEDYNTVMDAYRLIYHADPSDLHSPQSIFNVAELLADEATTLHKPKLYDDALGQFEFLRKQYPGSSLRISALYEEAQIAAADKRDIKLAREKYGEYITKYPKSSHAAEAQAALASLRSGILPNPVDSASVQDPEGNAAARPQRGTAPASETAAARTSRTSIAAASSGVPGAAVSPTLHAEASLAASQNTSARSTAMPVQPQSASDASATLAQANVPAHTKSGLATVSAIRHWSTPNYTRVAIDLGDEVQYEAARVPNPDRIYFDLHGTRLAQELNGKAFAVTDDGFLKRIRAAQYSNDMTRVVLDVNNVTEYSAFLLPNPYRLIIDIHGGTDATKSAPTAAPVERSATAERAVPAPQTASALPDMPPTNITATTAASRATVGREVAALSAQPDNQKATAKPTSQPIAVVADARGSQPAQPTAKQRRKNEKIIASDAAPVHAAAPTSDGERTLQRALGLKIGRIVIDAGHGGHDSGTLGAGGIMEKDVVLDVALRLGKLLHDKLGAEIIYTRSDDTFIPLETRTAIANKAEADLFLSIHANSSQDETARGVETYYLNFTSQPDALDVAARENAVSDQGIHQLADLVKKITLKDKIDESREFAADVDKSLFDGLKKGNEGLKDRGVKKAPFVVLIGANMPSILTEISFVTNGKDAAQLRTPEYRERVAESIFKGVAQYTSGLGGGTRVAANTSPDRRGDQ